MELTPAEAKLIKTLREADQGNPLGIDGYTAEGILPTLQMIAERHTAEAARRYRLFMEESKRQPLVDLTEAQRSKATYEDTRATPEEKASYEASYKHYRQPPPIWKTAPAGPRKSF